MKKYGWIALAVLAADRAAKLLAPRLSGPLTLIPGVLGLRYAENTGMAFGLFSGMPWLLGLLSLAVIAAAFWLLRGMRFGRLARIGLMLMLGGALGNAADRLLSGRVVDMIEFLFISFPVFNVADAALTVGCALLFWSLIRHSEEWSKQDAGA